MAEWHADKHLVSTGFNNRNAENIKIHRSDRKVSIKMRLVIKFTIFVYQSA